MHRLWKRGNGMPGMGNLGPEVSLSCPRRVGSHLKGLDLQGGVGLYDVLRCQSVERCSWGQGVWCFEKSPGLESSRGSAVCLWAHHSASLGFSFLTSKRGGQPQWSHCFNSLSCCLCREGLRKWGHSDSSDRHTEGWPRSIRPTIKAWCSVLPWHLVEPGGIQGLNAGPTPLLQVRSPSQQRLQGVGRGQHSSCHPSAVGIGSSPMWGMTQGSPTLLWNPAFPPPHPASSLW